MFCASDTFLFNHIVDYTDFIRHVVHDDIDADQLTNIT